MLSQAGVRRLLSFETREEVHGFLKGHGVYSRYSIEDVEHDLAEADRAAPRMIVAADR